MEGMSDFDACSRRSSCSITGEGDIGYMSEDSDEAPWIPTYSILLQTGQLDIIVSDSDEDMEEGDDEFGA